jgi:ABC-type Na+ transport system ATPase subunit NatA
MQMMGLTEWANIIAWTVTMLPFVLVAGVGASLLLTQLQVLPGANLFLVFFIIGLFILSFVPFALLISSVVKETKSAESLGQLLPIAFGALNFALVNERRTAPLYAAALVPACAMELAMNAVLELVKKGDTFGMSNVTDQSTGISYLGALGMLIFDICWMAALSSLLSSSSSSILLKKIIPDDQNPLLEALAEDGAENPAIVEPMQPMPGDRLSVRSLVKEFPGFGTSGPIRAVDNLSFELQEGEIYCLLGHNGAGKSTAISIITGLFGPTSGFVEALGLRLDTQTGLNTVRAQMGVCPQHDVLFDGLTVEEHLKLYGQIKGLSSETLETQMNDIISAVGLQEKRKEFSTKLSGGQKRRLSVAIALMGDPKILILDEPTAGNFSLITSPFLERVNDSVACFSRCALKLPLLLMFCVVNISLLTVG